MKVTNFMALLLVVALHLSAGQETILSFTPFSGGLYNGLVYTFKCSAPGAIEGLTGELKFEAHFHTGELFLSKSCLFNGLDYDIIDIPDLSLSDFFLPHTCDYDSLRSTNPEVYFTGNITALMHHINFTCWHDNYFYSRGLFRSIEWTNPTKITMTVDFDDPIPTVGTLVNAFCKSEGAYPLSTYNYTVLADGQPPEQIAEATNYVASFPISKAHKDGFIIKCNDVVHALWPAGTNIEATSDPIVPQYVLVDGGNVRPVVLNPVVDTIFECVMDASPSELLTYTWERNGDTYKESSRTLTLPAGNDGITTIVCIGSVAATINAQIKWAIKWDVNAAPPDEASGVRSSANMTSSGTPASGGDVDGVTVTVGESSSTTKKTTGDAGSSAQPLMNRNKIQSMLQIIFILTLKNIIFFQQ